MKKWLKFLKEFTDPENKKFAKDQVIEVDEETANYLIKHKFAEATDAPKTDDIIKKQMEEASKILEKNISDLVIKTVENIGKQLDERVKTIVNVKETPEGNLGFKDIGHFVDCVIKASIPNNTQKIAWPEQYVNKEGVFKAPSGVSTIDDDTGGFLIPETFAQGIWDKSMAEDQALLPRTDQRRTSGNNLTMLRQHEASRKAGYRHAGIQAYWLDEAAEFTASTPKWGKLELKLHKLAVLMYVTEEEMDDAPIAIGSTFEGLASKAINFLVNDAIVNGTGVGKPLGLLKLDSLIVVAKESGQANNTILHKNINKMYFRMAPELRSSAVWLVHPNLEEQLPFLRFHDDTATNQPIPIYFPAGMSGITEGGNFGTLKGRPVIPLEFCQDLGTKGDIIFANLGEYVTLQKSNGGIKSASSIHVRFLFEETAFRFSFRVGGNSLWSSPREDLNGTTKRGPFVVLDSRSSDTTITSGL